MLEDNRGWTFSLEEAIVWIYRHLMIKKKNQTRNFLHHKTLIDGLDWSVLDYLWIIVMFLSAVWTLILTAPIHWVYW